MDFKITRIVGELPNDLDLLRDAAKAENFLFVERLVSEWQTGKNCFDQIGEALFIARENGDVAGIGGITVDPIVPDALRMRRFYVRPAFRRYGLARLLADTLLRFAAETGKPIMVNAGTPDAPAFWEAAGFIPHNENGHTHILPSCLTP